VRKQAAPGARRALRVELRAIEISMLDHGSELDTVVAGRECARTGRRGETRDEVHVLAVGDAGQELGAAAKPELIPAHVRNSASGRGHESLDPPGNNPETARVVLGVCLVQELHAETYPEHRLRQPRQ